VNNVKNQTFITAFGEHLKQLRLNRGLSQEDLANEADIPINQIGRIERGEVNTTISTVYVIAKALDVAIAELFNFAMKEN